MNCPRIGIVTVLFNSSNVIDGFINSLRSQKFSDFKLYVIDNNSPDDSLTKITRLAKECTFATDIIAEKENWGVAKGNNIGIRHALADGCEYVLLANNDTEFEADTLEIMYQSITKSNYELLVPKILFYDTRLIWCAGGRFGLRKVTYHFGSKKHDSKRFNIGKAVQYSPTCFMLVKSDVFNQVGIMNEKYFVYYDDTDFVWRSVKQHGLTLYYEPATTVLHKVSTSTKSLPAKFTLYHNWRNCAYFMSKYFPWYRRWYTCSYMSMRYLLSMIKHPRRIGLTTVLNYYRQGLKMYRDEQVKLPIN